MVYSLCSEKNRVKHKETRDLNQQTDGMDDRLLENDIADPSIAFIWASATSSSLQQSLPQRTVNLVSVFGCLY